MPAVKMAWYRNAGPSKLKLKIGTAPGSPPLVFEAEPGETFEGPANYAKFFKRNGCAPASPPGAAASEPELEGLARAPVKKPEPEPLPEPEPESEAKLKRKSKGG